MPWFKPNDRDFVANLQRAQSATALLAKEERVLRQLRVLTPRLLSARQHDLLQLEAAHAALTVDLLRARARALEARSAAASALSSRFADLVVAWEASFREIEAARQSAAALSERRHRASRLRDLLRRARTVFDDGRGLRLHAPQAEQQRAFEASVCAPSAREGQLLRRWLLGAAPVSERAVAPLFQPRCPDPAAHLSHTTFQSPGERRLRSRLARAAQSPLPVAATPPPPAASSATAPLVTAPLVTAPAAASPAASPLTPPAAPPAAPPLAPPAAAPAATITVAPPAEPAFAAPAPEAAPLARAAATAAAAPSPASSPAAASPAEVERFVAYFARLVASSYALEAAAAALADGSPAGALHPGAVMPALELFASRLVFGLLHPPLFAPVRAAHWRSDAALRAQQRRLRALPAGVLAAELSEGCAPLLPAESDADFALAVGALSDFSFALAPADALLCVHRAAGLLTRLAGRLAAPAEAKGRAGGIFAAEATAAADAAAEAEASAAANGAVAAGGATATELAAEVPVGADALQPLMMLAAVHAQLPTAASSIDFASRYCSADAAASELGWSLAALEAATRAILAEEVAPRLAGAVGEAAGGGTEAELGAEAKLAAEERALEAGEQAPVWRRAAFDGAGAPPDEGPSETESECDEESEADAAAEDDEEEALEALAYCDLDGLPLW